MLKTSTIPILGNIHRSEFISIYRGIIEMIPDSVSEYSGSILFQSYPGEFSQAVIDRFIVLEPLAPILLFLGSASEGELRTGYPLQGCFRFYVHQWNEEYQHQLFLYWSGKPSLFTLPRTSENDEIAIFHTVSTSCPANNRKNIIPSHRSVLIVSRWGTLGNDSAMNQFLADFYRQQGFTTHFGNQNTTISFDGKIIADTDDSPFPKILESIQRLRRKFADSTITVYINSPRINEKIDLRNAGVDEIISKPVFW
ncbi:MAG: hypothetical protein LBE12_10315 [Planctomycetaceae bacterium]|jgi:hypothetical protein|nr:hypothetical protein [Planctomycetaceae bacterium]